MRKKKMITIVHDEIINSLMNIGVNHIKFTKELGYPYFYREISTKRYKIQLRAGIPKDKLEKYKNISSIDELEEKDRQEIEKRLSFSATETIIFYILLVSLAENEELKISLSQIHRAYRGKTLKNNELLDNKEKVIYMNTIKSLSEKQISIVTSEDFKIKSGLGNLISTLPLIIITNEENVDNDIVYDYSLGALERIVKLSRRFSNDILPTEFFFLAMKKIVEFKIGVYLSNLIFINRRKKQHYFMLKLKSFMKAIPYFDNEGKSTGVTYLEKMEENISNKTTILRRFFKNIIRVLDIYKNNYKILDYEVYMNFDNKSLNIEKKYFEKEINVKNFETVKFKIYFK